MSGAAVLVVLAVAVAALVMALLPPGQPGHRRGRVPRGGAA
jgi:hypothetical protein